MKSIKLSNTSKEPIYKQLYDQISLQILNRELPTDFPLPSIRTAAKEFRISIITVKKAWEELENNGYIYTVPGKGCFVSNLSNMEVEKKLVSQIVTKLKKDIEYYKSLGVDKEDIIEYIKKYYDS